MDNSQDFCSYSLALKLKRAGFDEPCIAQWACEPDGKPMLLGSTAFVFRNAELKGRDVTAPLLYHAQKWLREGAMLHVGACPAVPTLKWYFYIDDLNQHVNPHDGELMTRWDTDMQEKADERLYDSYECALSAGIYAALDLLAGKEGEK